MLWICVQDCRYSKKEIKETSMKKVVIVGGEIAGLTAGVLV